MERFDSVTNTTTTERIWHSISEYATRHFSVSSIEDITSDIAHKWLEGKIASGLPPQTIATYSAAIIKFGRAVDVLQERRKRHGKI